MMDYAASPQTSDMKPLETLSNIADEAERSAILISAFITRFRHGVVPTGETALKPVPSGHGGQIERLCDAIAQIDKLARDLNTLG